MCEYLKFCKNQENQFWR